MNVAQNDLSILVVDDDPLILNLAATALDRLGYGSIETAVSGNSALEIIRGDGPSVDILVLDLNMPEMDGIEFMGHAKNDGFRGGMILLSGEDNRMLETVLGLAKSQNQNVLGALSKPLQPDLINEMLQSYEPESCKKASYSPENPLTEEQLDEGIAGSTDNCPVLVYQPKIDIQTSEIVGVETLARWWNSERGLLGPGTFIPLAEQTGKIDSLTNEIYRRAVIQISEWQKQGISLTAAINFSVNSFAKREFCDYLVKVANEHDVSSAQITLEVTETQAMTLALDCLEALMGLRLKRFSLSIDDFGTGSSSMAQLKNIPFTELKVDRAFVNGAINNASSLAILEASVNLGKRLGMKIVAEGVETREDWDLVEQLGCDYVQGFYCAKPMRNEDLVEFLNNWSGPH